eukprot:scaffold14911_cov36-Phaeocystis_antarctica.AAC.1
MAPLLPMSAPTVVSSGWLSMKPSAHRAHPEYLHGLREGNRRLWKLASSSTQGSGWVPRGLALPGSTEPPRAARRALRRHRSRARALPRLHLTMPEYELRTVMTTGMSAPPMEAVMCNPRPPEGWAWG